MAAELRFVKPSTDSEKKTRTVVDTIMVTPKILEQWQTPPFQRPIRENEKVRALAEELKQSGGVMPGIITLGILNGTKYIIDGQHRKYSFLLSGIQEGYTDVRIHYFTSMAEMGEEFVRLNSQLVRMRPDDILRGLEGSLESLQRIREKCRFVGYDQIRRGAASPIVSMSMIIRCWRGSAAEVPSTTAAGAGAATLAQSMDAAECDNLIDFLLLAVTAFGRDPEYTRLWSALNITICMWMYRRLVLTQWSPRIPKLAKEQFKRCLMSLSAQSDYLDWLVGRMMGERDRSPAYAKIKHAFVLRLQSESQTKVSLPQPSWAHTSGGHH